jgi:hypothetical protein
MGDPLDQALGALLRRSLPASYYDGAAKVCGEFPRKVTYWDRGRGLMSTEQYIRQMFPELFQWGRRTVLELGPGSGHFMEFAREAGHQVHGYDCFPGSDLVQGYQLMAHARGLRIAYVGFHRVMFDLEAWKKRDPRHGEYDIIHAQRSMGGIVACHEQMLPSIPERRSHPFLGVCWQLLKPGGLLHLSHNVYDGLPAFCDEMSRFPGFRYEQIDAAHSRLWKD